jgi:hypothetical protein
MSPGGRALPTRAHELRPPVTPTTTAFSVQAVVSVAVLLLADAIAIWVLPADAWIRTFLAVSALDVTTSAFTLAKVVCDRQENLSVVSRLDQARLDKLLAEHDPFRAESIN